MPNVKDARTRAAKKTCTKRTTIKRNAGELASEALVKKKVSSGWDDPIDLPGTVHERVVRDWSQYQRNIFKSVAEDPEHLVVVARAGSGKTSTIVEALYHVPPNLTTIIVAFNKSIKDALIPIIPQNIEACTMHSLGMRAFKLSKPKSQFDQWKLGKMIEQVIGGSVWGQKDYSEQISKIVSLAKGHLAESTDELDELIDKYGIDSTDAGSRDVFISVVKRVLNLCRTTTDSFDYDDMVWLPLVLNMWIPQYDRVFVDETQDLNKAGIRLVIKALKPNGKICAVGDNFQGIYQFRGADEHAIPNIIKELNAKTLPLSVTYRCAKSIVRLANKTVPDLEAAPNAVEGTVTDISTEEMKKLARPGDFILSRVNAPLIGLAMSFLKDNRPANIQGRDIGSNLSGMIKKSKAKSVKDFESYVLKWKNEEIARLLAKKRDTISAEDKAECLLTLCEDAATLGDVKARIENLFSDTDDKNRIILSTTHKAKGLERSRVFVLANTYRKGKSVEEENLWYVAITRCKLDLFLVRK